MNQVLRRDIMPQSVIYQEWREEFLQEGEEREARSLFLCLLVRRIGEMSPDMRSHHTKSSMELRKLLPISARSMTYLPDGLVPRL
jgi:hypothetical protein